MRFQTAARTQPFSSSITHQSAGKSVISLLGNSFIVVWIHVRIASRPSNRP